MVKKVFNDESLHKLIQNIKNQGSGITSSTIQKIEFVDVLPAVEEQGTLYLVKESNIPEIEYVTNPEIEMGDISRSGTLSDSTEYCRTKDYVYVYGKSTVKITNNLGGNTRITCYDSNKNFIENWNVDGSSMYSYKNVSDGSTFNIPEDVYYIKGRFSSTTVSPLTLEYN